MSEENVKTVLDLFERFASGDFSPLDNVADDFEFVTSPEMPDAGTYRGKDARRWILTWVQSFDGLTIEAEETIDAGDTVVAAIVQRGRVPGGDTFVEGRWWTVWRFRGPDFFRAEGFPTRAEALEAAGLSE